MHSPTLLRAFFIATATPFVLPLLPAHAQFPKPASPPASSSGSTRQRTTPPSSSGEAQRQGSYPVPGTSPKPVTLTGTYYGHVARVQAKKRTVYETTQTFGREKGAPIIGPLFMKVIERIGKDQGMLHTIPEGLQLPVTIDTALECKNFMVGDVFSVSIDAPTKVNPKDPDDAEGSFGPSADVTSFPSGSYLEFLVVDVIPQDKDKRIPTTVYYQARYLVLRHSDSYEEAVPIVASLMKEPAQLADGRVEGDLADRYGRAAGRAAQAFTGSLDANFTAEAWMNMLGSLMKDQAERRPDVMTGKIAIGTPAFVRLNQRATY